MKHPRTLAKLYRHLVAIFLFGALLVVAGGVLFNLSASAATSPTLGAAGSYSVLGATTVTCTGTTTTDGDVGVAAGTAITGFPVPCTAGPPGTTHSNDASAIAAQADNLGLFDALDAGANADVNCIGGIRADGTDLTTLSPLVAGLYCSAGQFLLTGNLTLSGSPGDVWVFKTVSELIISSDATVTGGNPCDVWWRVGSSATLGTDSVFVGNILALTSISLQTGASLDGRALAQTGAVTLDSNTISTADCLTAATSTPTPTATARGPLEESFATNTPSPTPTPTATATPTVTPTVLPATTPPTPAQIQPPQTGDAGLLRQASAGDP